MTLRQKDASDIRPYTLLSGWCSFVPGVKTTMMSIEQGGKPLFGEDNLPDPWSSPIITRIQRGFNPVAVADIAYWEANKMMQMVPDKIAPAYQEASRILRSLPKPKD